MSSSARRRAAKAMIIFVAGLAAFAGGALAVNAATTGQQSAKKKGGTQKANVRIRAQVTGQLQPGVKVPLKISLANNRDKPLWIKRLRVMLAVDKAHAAAGCSVNRDYRVQQLPKKFFPYKVAEKPSATNGKEASVRWRALSAKKRQGKPTLSMLALPNVNQDACKGATLTIYFKTNASILKPKTKQASK